MRPSNKRSRSKQNRPRTLGNIVNRVFDSSGPEGKVRGTPQQIIDKYLVLARDAQLSGDRVAAENFLQHAEHYQRMLNEAHAEMAREAEARREQGFGGGQGQNGQSNGQNRRFDDREGGEAQGWDRREERQPQDRREERPQGERREEREGREGRMDWLGRRNRRFEARNRAEGGGRDAHRPAEPEGEGESMLVETPEARSEPRPAPRSEPKPELEPEPRAEPGPQPGAVETPGGEGAGRSLRPLRGRPRPPAEAEAEPAGSPAAEPPAADTRRSPRRRRAAAGPSAAEDSPDAAE